MQASWYSNRPNLRVKITEEDAAVDKEMYQHLVEKFINLSCTWLDILYVVSVINQFMHNPKESASRLPSIIIYIKETQGMNFLFKINGGLAIEAYTDVDYVG